MPFCFSRTLRLLSPGVLLLCLAVVGLSRVSAADEKLPQRPPNILFLLTDDQRPDTIAALGNQVIETPNLDALARRGTSFTRAVCANPICTPSRAEIISGVSGFHNGVLDFGRVIDPKLATWPRTLKNAGYHTWYVGKWHNNGRPDLHGYEDAVGLYSGGGGKWEVERTDWKGSKITGYRGWVFQNMDGSEKYPERGVGLQPDTGKQIADAAIELLGRKSDKPFFLHVNFPAPHDPLIMPPGYDDKYSIDKMPLPGNFLPEHPFDHGNFDGRDEQLLPWPRTERQVRDVLAMYYRLISYTDEQIGRILTTLHETGQEENTIVIFSADHGLGVGSHGIRGKQNMYEHTVNVPLIFAGPGIPPGERRDAQAYLRDLFPTTCAMAGVEIPETVEGRSLAGVIAGEEKSVYPHVFCYFRDKQRMLRTDRWKVVYYPHLDRYQLFDLKNDPLEMNDLSGDAAHRETFDEMRRKLREEQAAMNDPVLAK
ncbi:MAG: sulfatase-like hydrolase/transferase [Pirellulaceae bacterium]